MKKVGDVLHKHKISFAVFVALRLLVIMIMVRQIILHNYEGAFLCILTLLLFYLPKWIQLNLPVELPQPLEGKEDIERKEAEKEKFYQEAERQLKEAGIDFIEVDRECFGVRGNVQDKTVDVVLITLKAFSYRHLNSVQKNKLKELENWECLDKYKQGNSRPIFMHSRILTKGI